VRQNRWGEKRQGAVHPVAGHDLGSDGHTIAQLNPLCSYMHRDLQHQKGRQGQGNKKWSFCSSKSFSYYSVLLLTLFVYFPPLALLDPGIATCTCTGHIMTLLHVSRPVISRHFLLKSCREVANLLRPDGAGIPLAIHRSSAGRHD
jgi:hypothetical protein